MRYNLSVSGLLAIAGRATGVVGAGFVEGENQRVALTTEAQSLTPDEPAKTVVAYQDGAAVLLGDVAEVRVGAAPPIGAASVDGKPAVLLLVTEKYRANTLDVTRRLEQAVEELRPANYILTALRDVPEAMAIGGALVVLALILFLFNLRTAAISVLAIPLSLLTAVTVMRRLGFSLNIMVMGGLTTSTVLNLLVVPTLAPRWGRFTRPEPEEVG